MDSHLAVTKGVEIGMLWFLLVVCRHLIGMLRLKRYRIPWDGGSCSAECRILRWMCDTLNGIASNCGNCCCWKTKPAPVRIDDQTSQMLQWYKIFTISIAWLDSVHQPEFKCLYSRPEIIMKMPDGNLCAIFGILQKRGLQWPLGWHFQYGCSLWSCTFHSYLRSSEDTLIEHIKSFKETWVMSHFSSPLPRNNGEHTIR